MESKTLLLSPVQVNLSDSVEDEAKAEHTDLLTGVFWEAVLCSGAESGSLELTSWRWFDN